jgi:hypothetical protein
MTDEKWLDTISTIRDKFGIVEQSKEELAEEGGGTVERVIFNSPLGKIKLERTVRPLVVGKKTTGSKRIGSTTRVDYVFSDTEKIHKLNFYKWNDKLNDWEEMKIEQDAFKL